MAQKFEYKVLPQDLYSADQFEETLNALGLEGWELITVKQQGNAMSGVLRRLLTGEPDGSAEIL